MNEETYRAGSCVVHWKGGVWGNLGGSKIGTLGNDLLQPVLKSNFKRPAVTPIL